jgi:hypothetical protein
MPTVAVIIDEWWNDIMQEETGKRLSVETNLE